MSEHQAAVGNTPPRTSAVQDTALVHTDSDSDPYKLQQSSNSSPGDLNQSGNVNSLSEQEFVEKTQLDREAVVAVPRDHNQNNKTSRSRSRQHRTSSSSRNRYNSRNKKKLKNQPSSSDEISVGGGVEERGVVGGVDGDDDEGMSGGDGDGLRPYIYDSGDSNNKYKQWSLWRRSDFPLQPVRIFLGVGGLLVCLGALGVLAARFIIMVSDGCFFSVSNGNYDRWVNGDENTTKGNFCDTPVGLNIVISLLLGWEWQNLALLVPVAILQHTTITLVWYLYTALYTIPLLIFLFICVGLRWPFFQFTLAVLVFAMVNFFLLVVAALWGLELPRSDTELKKMNTAYYRLTKTRPGGSEKYAEKYPELRTRQIEERKRKQDEGGEGGEGSEIDSDHDDAEPNFVVKRDVITDAADGKLQPSNTSGESSRANNTSAAGDKSAATATGVGTADEEQEMTTVAVQSANNTNEPNNNHQQVNKAVARPSFDDVASDENNNNSNNSVANPDSGTTATAGAHSQTTSSHYRSLRRPSVPSKILNESGVWVEKPSVKVLCHVQSDTHAHVPPPGCIPTRQSSIV